MRPHLDRAERQSIVASGLLALGAASLFAVLFAPNPNDALGLPTARQITLHRTGYTICYDSIRRQPVWACYRLTRDDLKIQLVDRPPFAEDSEIPIWARARDSDYDNPGFDRGPLVPFADMLRSPQTVRESMLLSNVAPQNPSLNRGPWAQYEQDIRKLLLGGSADEAWIYVGTLFGFYEPPISSRRIAVPGAWWKLVIAKKADTWLTEAAIFANRPDSSKWLVSIDELERLSGLELARNCLAIESHRGLALALSDCVGDSPSATPLVLEPEPLPAK